MTSINSGGGPLVCLELDVVDQWGGVASGFASHAAGAKSANDYERACSIRDYLGKVPLGDREALILGDEPLETFIWTPSGYLARIARVYYGDPGVDVESVLELAGELDSDDALEVLSFEFKSSPIVVFDSAYPGHDTSVERLLFEIPEGKYRVVTKQFEPDSRTSLLIHMFMAYQ